MKHLQAGLLVGGIALAAALAITAAWWLLSLFVGDMIAMAVLLAVLGAAIIAAAIDWVTEKR